MEVDPSWAAAFDQLRARIWPSIQDVATSVEHVGSTSVKGLAAKPIIDILIAVRSLPLARTTMIDPIIALGYVYWAENPKTDRMFFVKGMAPYGKRRTHHVHIRLMRVDEVIALDQHRDVARDDAGGIFGELVVVYADDIVM